MKKTIFVVVLLVVNVFCLQKMYALSKLVPEKLDSIQAENMQRMAKLDAVIFDVEMTKKALGWKTYELSAGACMSPELYMEGAFSASTGDMTNCKFYELSKLNSFVKETGTTFDGDRFRMTFHVLTSGGSVPSLTESDLLRVEKLVK